LNRGFDRLKMSLFIDVLYLQNIVFRGKDFQDDTCFVSCELFGFTKLWLYLCIYHFCVEMADILSIDYCPSYGLVVRYVFVLIGW